MPKNENGDVVCINHPEEILANTTFVSFPQMLYNINQGNLQSINQAFPAKLMNFCKQCGYMELYTIRPEDDLPGHNIEIVNE